MPDLSPVQWVIVVVVAVVVTVLAGRYNWPIG
jgi:hypothetical protein